MFVACLPAGFYCYNFPLMNTTLAVATSNHTYTIERATATPELTGQWQGRAWGGVPALSIDQFHLESRSRHPRTQAKLLYDSENLYVHFRVEDNHVYSVYTNYQDPVCRDSCVEFFVEPIPGKGYFNFEINCGGAMLLFFIADAERNPEGYFMRYVRVPLDVVKQVKLYHSMPQTTPVTIHEPVTWTIEAAIPFALFQHYLPEFRAEAAHRMRGNLFKCGGDIGHYHWASWMPAQEELNFHQPDVFGDLIFA